jgi:predicted dehydrogenase
MEITLAALAAGKAVLCEKPTAMNADEARRMRDAAREAKQLAHLDHELRFLPGRRRMREMILGGELGKIRHAKFLFRSDSRVARERAWDWWSDAEQGGGTLGAIGSHAVDTLNWLLAARVSHVSCTLATHVSERPDRATGEARRVTSDDEANLLLHFLDGEATEGATGAVSMSVVEPGRPEHRVEVFGERGALRIEDSGELWHADAGAGAWRQLEVEDAPLAEGMRDSGWSRGFTVFAREIVAALREGRESVPEAATFEDGYDIQLVLDAARNAHESGCRVTVGA